MSAMDSGRALVSVIYADLVGFTSRSHAADPAAIRAIQRPFHARVKHEVERRGGRVEKLIGDAVVAVFGAEGADRNDAERAVRVALRIPELVDEINAAQGLDLAVRVGVNSDVVEVTGDGHAEGVVTGDVVNVAGKLQSAAVPGGVAVCQTTYEQTCARFRYEALDPVELPGQVEPAPAWQPAARRRRAATGTSAPIDEAEPEGAEEVRQVSILFADLVDFSLRSHSSDSEDMRRLLRPYFVAMKREIERYGGSVEKFVGDAVMAVFGAPVAREDDAERAVRAALRLPAVVVELNEDDAFREVAVRAAVNSGEAAVALEARFEEGEGLVTGDAVNTAARLLGAAPVGAVVVGESTQAATAGFVDYEALPPLHAKGKPEPLAVFRALAARENGSLAQAAVRQPPFVGRGQELSLLKGTLARVLYERTPQVVVLTAPAGTGKSRLVSEFSGYAAAAEESVLWHRGQSLPYGGLAFSALGDLVKNAAAILKSDGVEDAAEKLAAVVRAVTTDDAERERLQSALAPLAGTDAEGEPQLAGWLRYLVLGAMQRPAVCLLEDAQWAPPPVVSFIEHLADFASGPLLVLVTSREPVTWGRGRPNVTHVDLPPLTDEEVGRVLAGLGAEGVEPTQAGGNPLLAVELARLARDVPGSSLPAALEDVVAARLEVLEDPQRRALAAGAVVGRSFWAGAVGAVVGAGVQDACRLLDDLVARELIQGARVSTVAREAEYAFLHPSVREAVYARTDERERAAAHEAVAGWLDRALGGRPDHGALAHHHRAAAAT